MPEKINLKEMVSFEELLKPTISAQDALISLLEKRGIITKTELIEEIKRIRKVS